MDTDLPNLRDAIALHVRAMLAKRCTPRSVATLLEETDRHLEDWMERDLASLRRHEVALRHERITAERGPYVANRVMQQFRAVWNTAARRFEELPQVAPTVAVTMNRTERRREPIPWDELPAWRAAVARLRNPVRRDLQSFLLLTGLRSLDARTVRWSDVAFEHVATEVGESVRATLHRPSPKGGARRAFTVPVADAVAALLQRRRAQNAELFDGGDGGWVFPTRDRVGRVTHVQEPKQQRTVRRADGSSAKVRHLPSPHRLRDTFATAAHEVGVSPLDLKVLLNHALPAADDVTAGYIRPSEGHLRESVERIARFLEERLGGVGTRR
ncbi:MAG: tyrosine-type recombinase/integrase [Planctomycetota bacterium]